ncbi:MAG: reverse gyrase [Epsilonproteobacteria bacterium]|nr:reverse gyrase [Campylobacterota bacterium]
MLESIYKNRCPRCHGDITSNRLQNGEFCDKCMSEIKSFENCENLMFYEKFCKAKEKLEEFNDFFHSKTGNDLSDIQKMWAKRYFLDNSFALLAPTGIGKTTFGLLLSAFEKNSYIIFPTKLLVLQALERFKSWGIDVLAYTGKKQEKEKIKSGEYDILITTTQFLYKNREIINKDFKLVFVDDVDSILKSAKKIDDVLSLVGFSKEDIDEALRLIEKKEYEKLQEFQKKKKGNLIVSSATANPKSKRVLLFKYLLGFEISRPNLSLRNVIDSYDVEYSWQKSVEWIRRLGRGGLLFLPGNESKEKVYEYIEFLKKNSIKAYSYEEFEEKIEEFKKGECFFVGFASYKNPLARGIDLPEFIRYTLFVGVPKMEFRLSEDNYRSLYFILLSVYPYLLKNNILNEDEKIEFQKAIEFMKKYVFFSVLHPNVEKKLSEISQKIKKFIKKYENEIKNSPEISFDSEKLIVADITGYIQASGRSSRFYKGHLTKGLALTLVDNQKAFYSLKKRLSWFVKNEFVDVNTLDLDEVLKEIDESRKSEEKIALKTTFVVVESPTKAKTISEFFGKASRRVIEGVSVYEILSENRVLLISASIGHDFDLVHDEGVWGVKDKYIPIFHVLENKDKILDAFNLTSAEVEEVIIATDPDREGEKIAFDLTLNNKPYNFNIKRAEFHEITKYAFEEALNNLREVNKNWVAAQFLRRISDRWVGFKISQYLQKLLKNAHLSAGRVQTPVLRWICERTESLKEKIYVVRVSVSDVNFEFVFEDKQKAKEFFEKIDKVVIKKVSQEIENYIFTPFNTSALLKEAALKLRFSPQKTMKLAQELFESGFITYHRTDSIRISPLGEHIAKEYIKERFGSEFVKLRSFESSGGAHEAIRATSAMDANDLKSYLLMKNLNLTNEHIKLYDLIFRRFIASQMKEAVVKKEKFSLFDKEFEFLTEILEHGCDLVYEIEIKKVNEGEFEAKKEIFEKSKFTPFTYAEVIDTMKEKGIGRPSTYAITIEKLLERKYIIEKHGFLFATRLGFKVIDILDKSEYKEFVSEEFTAKLEELMDEIEEGKGDYKKELIKLFSLLF